MLSALLTVRGRLLVWQIDVPELARSVESAVSSKQEPKDKKSDRVRIQENVVSSGPKRAKRDLGLRAGRRLERKSKVLGIWLREDETASTAGMNGRRECGRWKRRQTRRWRVSVESKASRVNYREERLARTRRFAESRAESGRAFDGRSEDAKASRRCWNAAG